MKHKLMLSYFTDIIRKISCRIHSASSLAMPLRRKARPTQHNVLACKMQNRGWSSPSCCSNLCFVAVYILSHILFNDTQDPLAARHSGGQIFRLYNYGKNFSARGHTKADRRGRKQYVPPKSKRIPPSRSRKTMRHSRSGKTTYPSRNKTITRLT